MCIPNLTLLSFYFSWNVATTSLWKGVNLPTIHYFSPSNLLTLYKAQIRPCLEYCSHIWGAAAPTTLSILDVVQRRAIRLIGDPALTCHLQPLSHRPAVGDLSTFLPLFKRILLLRADRYNSATLQAS
nr:unnamed protein product [Callosobruchus chinensis]